MFPLVSHMEFGVGLDLALAVVLGLGFGFCLERAGFGSARKLTAVFYLFDMSVVKVMFTAIVTAMVGLFVLSAAGRADLADLYSSRRPTPRSCSAGSCSVPVSSSAATAPGTSIAAMATGKKDGAAFALGMLAGVFAYAEFTPGLEGWIKATSQGEMTLPALTGIGMGWWTLAFVLFLFARGARHGLAAAALRYLKPQRPLTVPLTARRDSARQKKAATFTVAAVVSAAGLLI